MVGQRLSGQLDASFDLRRVRPALCYSNVMDDGREGLSRGVVPIQLQSATEQPEGLIARRLGECKVICQGLQIEVVGVKIVGPLRGCSLDFRSPEARLDGSDDTLGDAVLQIEDVREFTVEPVCPECRPLAASISCPVIRTRFPALRIEPSRT